MPGRQQTADFSSFPRGPLSDPCPGHGDLQITIGRVSRGLIRAAQVVAIGITPKRFRSLRQFWSYCGLAVVMRTSSDWVRQDGQWVRSDNVSKTRGLTRKRQPMLKAAFKGAATVVVGRMKEHPLTCKYRQLCDAGTKPSLALLTIARKIAAAVFAMWRNEEAYDPGHRSSQPRPT
jgi:hypothetical protein